MNNIPSGPFQYHLEEAYKVLAEAPFTRASETVIRAHFKTLLTTENSCLQNHMKLLALAFRIRAVEHTSSFSSRIYSFAIRTLFQNNVYSLARVFLSQEFHVTNVFDELPLSLEEKALTCIFATRFIKKGMNPSSIRILLTSLIKIPADEREILFNAAFLLIKETTNGCFIADVLCALSSIPSSKRENVSFFAAPIIKESTGREGIKSILQAIADIPIEERELICSHALRFHIDASNKPKAGYILKVIHKIAPEKRNAVFSAAEHIVKTSKKSCFIGNILDIINSMTEEAIRALDKTTQSLLDEGSQYKIVQESINNICIFAAFFIKENMYEYNIIPILNQIAALPEKERENFCITTVPLIKEGVIGDSLIATLSLMGRIPDAERSAISKLTILMLRKDTNQWLINDIITIVSKIPESERENFSQTTAPLIKDDAIGDSLIGTLKAMAAIPALKRTNISQAAGLFMKANISQRSINTIIHKLNVVSEEEIESFCQSVIPLINRGMDENVICAILNAVATVPADLRLQISKELSTYITDQVIGAHKIINLFYEAMTNLLPESIKERMPIWASFNQICVFKEILIELTSKNIIDDLSSSSQIFMSFRDYLPTKITVLIQNQNNVKKLISLIEFTFRNTSLLGITEDSVMMNYLIGIYTQLDPSLNNSPNNIYIAHNKMLSRKKEPLSSDVSKLTLQGKLLKFDFEAIFKESRLKEPTLLTFGDLPEVDPNSFSIAFKAFEERLESCSEEEQQKILDQITPLGKLQGLKSMCVDPLNRIYQWMHFSRGKPEETAPKQVTEIYSLAQALNETSNEILAEDLLTSKERMLLSIASSIRACYAGQDGGIHAAYKLLPRQALEVDGVIGYESSEEAGVRSYFKPLLQKQIVKIDSFLSEDNPMMRELLPLESAFNQLVHQTQYLKNLLKDDLHLDYSITLDQHAGSIDSSLRDKTREEILKIFYKHYAEDLLFSVEKNINRDLAQMDSVNEEGPRSRKLYADIDGFLGQNQFPIGFEAWDLDENTNLPQIKTNTVLNLLKATGIFKEAIF